MSSVPLVQFWLLLPLWWCLFQPPLVPSGLTLAPALGVFPQKLVDKARTGAYIEMREFLGDNILLLEQLETLQGNTPMLAAIPGAVRPRLREVTSPLTRVYCFFSYMGVCTSDPTTQNQASYASLRPSGMEGAGGWSI